MNNQGRKQSSDSVVPFQDKSETKSNKFVKGQSGNPSGRPKGAKSKVTIMKEGMEADWLKFLKQEDPNLEERKARWSMLMEKVYEQAMNGDTKALQLIMGEVHKDLRAMNQIQAKQDSGPRSVKININTKESPMKTVGEVLDQLEDDSDGQAGTEGSAERTEEDDLGL